MVLSQKEEGIRFNELKRLLELLGVNYSTPKMDDHLNKHLVKQNIVIREKKGKQNVVYRINKDKFESSGRESMKLYKMFMNDFEYIPSLSIEGQIVEFLRRVSLLELHQLIASINYRVNKTPDSIFELFVLINPIWKYHQAPFLVKCKKDKKFREKAVNKINEYIDKLSEK